MFTKIRNRSSLALVSLLLYEYVCHARSRSPDHSVLRTRATGTEQPGKPSYGAISKTEPKLVLLVPFVVP